jgi:phage recombination protein Bet
MNRSKKTQPELPTKQTAPCPTEQPPEPKEPDNNGAAEMARLLEGEVIRFVPFGATRELELTMEDVRRTIATPTKTGKLPSGREIVTFLKLCEFRGLNPYVGDAFLVGYDTKEGPSFSSIVSHQAMLKRADAHDKYRGMRSGVILWDKEALQKVHVEGDVVPKTEIVIGGWCQVYREDREHNPIIEAAMTAYNKGFGHWNVDPNWMICKCAQAKSFRSAFPNDLEGMELREEVEARLETENRVAGAATPTRPSVAEQLKKEAAEAVG